MNDDLLAIVKQIVARLAALALEDRALRTGLRRLAEIVLAPDGDLPLAQSAGEPQATDEQSQHAAESVDSPAALVDHAGVETDDAGRPPDVAAAATDSAEETSGVETVDRAVAAPRFYRAPVTDADLPLIETRCRLKAEGVRWSIERRRLLAEGAERWEIADRDREIIARAQQIEDCFLWMNHRDWLPPEDQSLVEDLASCFETAADAVALVHAIKAKPGFERDLFEPALDLVAEAQSGLRVAVSKAYDRCDSDQEGIHSWLRETARERQILIDRYMRLNDTADPKRWADLSARILELDGNLQAAESRAKEQRRLLNKVRYLAKQISERSTDANRHWTTLDRTVEELVAQGVPPSNRELREALLPTIDGMPDVESLSPVFAHTLREVDRFLASRLPGDEAIRQPAWSADVSQVAELLNGRNVVLIGGERRPAAHDALARAFKLNELVWLSTREHASLDRFEPAVARPEVALVLLAIRWSSHSYGDVQSMCEQHGKPFVRLPAGYNANQVAAQILAQCGDRLRESATARP